MTEQHDENEVEEHGRKLIDFIAVRHLGGIKGWSTGKRSVPGAVRFTEADLAVVRSPFTVPVPSRAMSLVLSEPWSDIRYLRVRPTGESRIPPGELAPPHGRRKPVVRVSIGFRSVAARFEAFGQEPWEWARRRLVEVNGEAVEKFVFFDTPPLRRRTIQPVDGYQVQAAHLHGLRFWKVIDAETYERLMAELEADVGPGREAPPSRQICIGHCVIHRPE